MLYREIKTALLLFCETNRLLQNRLWRISHFRPVVVFNLEKSSLNKTWDFIIYAVALLPIIIIVFILVQSLFFVQSDVVKKRLPDPLRSRSHRRTPWLSKVPPDLPLSRTSQRSLPAFSRPAATASQRHLSGARKFWARNSAPAVSDFCSKFRLSQFRQQDSPIIFGWIGSDLKHGDLHDPPWKWIFFAVWYLQQELSFATRIYESPKAEGLL